MGRQTTSRWEERLSSVDGLDMFGWFVEGWCLFFWGREEQP